MELFIIALLGGLGSLLRWYLGGFNQAHQLPLGTLIANLLGCFLIGLLLSSAQKWTPYIGDMGVRALSIGLLGGLTTFSSFSYDSLLKAQNGEWWLFASNIGLNLLPGILLVYLGIYLGKSISG